MLRERVPVENMVADPYNRESVLEEAHPLKLAEEIGFLALDTAQSISPQRYSENITTGWKLVEKALSVNVSSAKQGFFAAAQLRFETAALDPADLEEEMRVSTALVALPSLKSRIYGKRPGSRILAETYQKTGLILSRIAQRPELCGGSLRDEEDEQVLNAHGILTESLTYAMLLRHNKTGLFPYLATPREDRSSGKFKPYNHDLYTIDKDFGKIPIQVKRNEEDTEAKAEWRLRDGIATVVLNPLINEEIRALRKEMVADGDDVGWYTTYRTIGRPDTFLAQCLEPNQHTFPNSHHAYAASALVKRVSTAVVRVLRPQIDVLQQRATGTTAL